MKQPFALHDPELRRYLHDVNSLLNYCTAFEWQPFADEKFEELYFDLLEKRKKNLFLELYQRETKEFSEGFLNQSIMKIAGTLRACGSKKDLEDRIADAKEEDGVKMIDFRDVADSDISMILYRNKTPYSIGRKTVRKRGQDDSESGRNDTQGMRLIVESRQAKKYLRELPWTAFENSVLTEIISKASRLMEDVNGRNKKSFYKNVKGTDKTDVQRCDYIIQFLKKNRTDLEAIVDLKEFDRLLVSQRCYANLKADRKKEYSDLFESADESREGNHYRLLKDLADRIIQNHAWATLPYKAINMDIQVSDKRNDTKRLTMISRTVMSHDEAFDVDYILADDKYGQQKFLAKLGIPKDRFSKTRKGLLTSGRRKHIYRTDIDEDVNYTVFRDGNLILYVSSDSSTSEKLMKKAYEIFLQTNLKMDELRKKGENTELKWKDILYQDSLQMLLSKASDEYLMKLMPKESRQTDKNRNTNGKKGDDKKKADNGFFKEDLFGLQRQILEYVQIRNSDLGPEYVVYHDTFRADICAKFPFLSAVNDPANNLDTFTRSYLLERRKPENGYESIQFRVSPASISGNNKESCIEIQERTPKMDVIANMGKASHKAYEEKEYQKIPEKERDVVELFFGDDNGLFFTKYSQFHSSRIARNAQLAFDEYKNGNPVEFGKRLMQALISYSLLHGAAADMSEKAGHGKASKTDDKTAENFDKAQITKILEDSAKPILELNKEYFRLQPIANYRSLCDGKTDIHPDTGLKDFENKVTQHMGLLAQEQALWNDLGYKGIDGLIDDSRWMHEQACERTKEIFSKLYDRILPTQKARTKKIIQLFFYHMIKDFSDCFDYMHALPGAGIEAANNLTSKLDELADQLTKNVSRNWRPTDRMYSEIGLEWVPRGIDPEDLQNKKMFNRDMIIKNLTPLGKDAVHLGLEYFQMFAKKYLTSSQP